MRAQLFIACSLMIGSPTFGYGQNSTPSPDKEPPRQPAAHASPQRAAIDPAKEADIRRLLDLVGVKDLVHQTMESMSTTMKPTLTNSLPPGEYRARLVDLFFARFLSQADPQHLLNLAVPIYDKSFSHEEIKGLIRFYETPLGQKAISVLPQVMNEMHEAGRKWGEELGRKTMQDILAENPDLASALEAASKARQQ